MLLNFSNEIDWIFFDEYKLFWTLVICKPLSDRLVELFAKRRLIFERPRFWHTNSDDRFTKIGVWNA